MARKELTIVIEQLSPRPNKPLTVVCPPGARLYLLEQQALFDIGLGASMRGTDSEIHFVDCYPIEAGKYLGAVDPRSVIPSPSSSNHADALE